jgi:hypothetical protein
MAVTTHYGCGFDGNAWHLIERERREREREREREKRVGRGGDWCVRMSPRWKEAEMLDRVEAERLLATTTTMSLPPMKS